MPSGSSWTTEATVRAIERLAERARQAGMVLNADVPAGVSGIRIRANALALEQILFNLVDNACKYAAGATDRRIVLQAVADERHARLRVRDYGPGVAPRCARRLFRAFGKSAADAANSAPGIGLGLALSRRLARAMGGDLGLEGADAGASFVVTLRRAEPR